MRIAVIGAGFTGLSAALRLSVHGHDITVFEKGSDIGGLSAGFHDKDWLWTLEYTYHHLFVNDSSILDLAKKLNHKVLVKKPSTDVLINGRIMPFDSIKGLLSFNPLPLVDRLRIGLSILYLKRAGDFQKFNNQTALGWIKRFMGKNSLERIWDPLFSGKFGEYKDKISLIWLWARFKKRTQKLAYPEGGFKVFAQKIKSEILRNHGQILLNSPVSSLSSGKKVRVKAKGKIFIFDKVIATCPSPVFAKIAKGLNKSYINKLNSIPHFSAQTLILILKKPFMKKSYWLNIAEKDFPFVILAEHTNFIDSKYYGNRHILYIGNYLPDNHPFLKFSADKLLTIFNPYLKKINPNYSRSLISCRKFSAPFAQPIMTKSYSRQIPKFKTPLKNVYIANLDMVYPWDRGTNYAVEMGEKIAKITA